MVDRSWASGVAEDYLRPPPPTLWPPPSKPPQVINYPGLKHDKRTQGDCL
jgi:hypothetical protein